MDLDLLENLTIIRRRRLALVVGFHASLTIIHLHLFRLEETIILNPILPRQLVGCLGNLIIIHNLLDQWQVNLF